MKRIIWSGDARRELEQLNDWYAQFSVDLPLTLTLRIEAALIKLLDFPLLGASLPDSTRRKWVVRGTPYLVLYRPTPDGIRILSVRHVRSNWTADA